MCSTPTVEAVYAGIVAVLGTLLGSSATYVFQRRVAERGEHFSRTERVRQDRLSAYSTFAEAVTEYRGSQYKRWSCEQVDPASAESSAAEAESHRLRGVTRQIRWRMQLLTEDQELIRLADEAVICAKNVREAADLAERQRKHDAAGEAIERFVLHAASHVR